MQESLLAESRHIHTSFEANFAPERISTISEGYNRLVYTEGGFSDMDGVYLQHGIIPKIQEGPNKGDLDIEALKKQSPDTFEIIRNYALLELHGIPVVTITGKSATATLIAELKAQILVDEAIKLGMLKSKPVRTFGATLDIADEFKGPDNRMYAIKPDGTVNKERLVISLFEYDNGATIIEFNHPDEYYHADKLSRGFLEKMVDFEFIELLKETTKQEKKDRQVTVNGEHVCYVKRDIPENVDINTLKGTDYWYAVARKLGLLATDEQILFADKVDISKLDDKQLWSYVMHLYKEFSYASPHGSKFNLELKDVDQELLDRWDAFAKRKLEDTAFEVKTFKDIQNLFTKMFETDAAVSTNYVHEVKMGDRIVIDFNPFGVDKRFGYLKAVSYIKSVYEKAGMTAPDFDNFAIGIGDGPDRNDKALVCDPMGVTNSYNEHEKTNGFPVDMEDLFALYNIFIRRDLPKEKQLNDTEHTFIYTQLMLFEHGIIKEFTLPKRILDKLYDVDSPLD